MTDYCCIQESKTKYENLLHGSCVGCKVIGFAGSDEKVEWLQTELGFDLAFNYKGANLDQTLKEHVPEGVDCYFDSVRHPHPQTPLINTKQGLTKAWCFV